MVKQLRRTRQRKKFNYDRNRKRVNKKIHGTGKVKCPEIRKEWNERKNIRSNLRDMGLQYDSNKAIKMPNNKQDRLKAAKKLLNGFIEEDMEVEVVAPRRKPSKIHVAQKLEEDARALRVSKFRLPKGQVTWITYLIKTYGFNYKLMEKDSKNYQQETWRQLRAKVKKFLSIPAQCTEFLKENGLLDNELDPNDPRWQEPDSDDD